MPPDAGHAQQRGQDVHQQQSPRCPEEAERHRAEGQTGGGEHDPDVLQRLLQGNGPRAHQGLANVKHSLIKGGASLVF